MMNFIFILDVKHLEVVCLWGLEAKLQQVVLQEMNNIIIVLVLNLCNVYHLFV